MLPSSPLDISIASTHEKSMSTGTCTVVYAPGEGIDKKNRQALEEDIARIGLDPLRPFVGTALVLEVKQSTISAADLIPLVLAILGKGEGVLPERLLFKTSSENRDAGQYSYFGVDAIEYLYMQGVRLIGVDSPSIDQPTKSDISMLMRVNRMHWLVNVDLAHVPADKLYLLFSAPAERDSVGTVPCRAFVVPLS